jgi:hypothetical protein
VRQHLRQTAGLRLARLPRTVRGWLAVFVGVMCTSAYFVSNWLSGCDAWFAAVLWGKALYPELKCDVRAPLCGSTCGRLLDCGLHTCQERCVVIPLIVVELLVGYYACLKAEFILSPGLLLCCAT